MDTAHEINVRNQGVESGEGMHVPRFLVEAPRPTCSRGLVWLKSEVRHIRSRLFSSGKQAATVRGGTAVAGFFGGIVVGHCGLTKWRTARKFDV